MIKKIVGKYSILTIGALIIGSLFAIGSYAAIRSITGIAVAQSSTKWNSLKDGAQGDNLTNGVGAFALYGFDGTNFDRLTATNGVLDVSISSSVTPADTFTNPTDASSVFSLNALFNGTTWDRIRGDIPNGLDVDVTRIIPGVAATNLGKAEDAIHANGDTGILQLGVRNDSGGTLVGADGDYAPLQINKFGSLVVQDSSLNHGMFGSLITGSRVNQVEVKFSQDDPGNLVTVVVTNSGTAVRTEGLAVFSSSTNTNGTAKGTSLTNVIYRPGHEQYTVFTAAFTACIANSHQRIGLYDAVDGFIIGCEGTSFGITHRRNSVDVSVAQASFSEDVLAGVAGSKFTRAGTAESLDITLMNIYRIRFGWLGSADIVFEIYSPDGEWLPFHKILRPNASIEASLIDPDLPIEIDVAKSGADGTNLIMRTGSWAGGTSSNVQRIDSSVTDATLASFTRSILTARKPDTTYTNIGATAGGSLKVSIEEGTVTLSDNFVNPTDSINMNSAMSEFDGTTWDRVRHSFIQETTGITTNAAGTTLEMSATPMSKHTMIIDRTAGSTDLVEIDLECAINGIFVQIGTITDLSNEPVLTSIDGTTCNDIQYNVVTVGAGNTLTIQLLAVR